MDRSYLLQNKKLAAVIFSLIVATFVTGILMNQREERMRIRVQESLAEEVLRFHVLANSDSEEDQALKMQVKEAILSYLEVNMPETEDMKNTRGWVKKHTDELEKIGKEVIQKEGYTYTVSAAVTTCWFPEKVYGDMVFPQGNYQALRVEIGDAKGKNWWCVLYPELCFMNAVNAVVPEEGKQKLKNVLTEEEYSYITLGKDFEIRWYFLENLLTIK